MFSDVLCTMPSSLRHTWATDQGRIKIFACLIEFDGRMFTGENPCTPKSCKTGPFL